VGEKTTTNVRKKWRQCRRKRRTKNPRFCDRATLKELTSPERTSTENAEKGRFDWKGGINKGAWYWEITRKKKKKKGLKKGASETEKKNPSKREKVGF